jgi:hypothetical protein
MKQITLINENYDFLGKIFAGQSVKVPKSLTITDSAGHVSLNGVSIRAENYAGMVLAYPTDEFMFHVRNTSISGKHICYPFDSPDDDLELRYDLDRDYLTRIPDNWQNLFNVPVTPIQLPVYFKNPFKEMEETVCGRIVIDSETQKTITKNWDKRRTVTFTEPYANKFVTNVSTEFLDARFKMFKFTDFKPYVKRLDLISKVYESEFLSCGLSLIQTSSLVIRARYVLFLGKNVLETPDMPEYNCPTNERQLVLMNNMASKQMDKIYSRVRNRIKCGDWESASFDALKERFATTEVKVIGYNAVSPDYLTLINATNEDYR